MKNFADKVVVITGAGSGIGRALAVSLATEGAHLALMDVDEVALRETLGMLPGAEHIGRCFDVSEREQMSAFRQHVIETFGQVDIVINNAGVAHSQTIADTDIEDFRWIMGINFWGVVHGSQAFLPDLLAREEASLVNISSVFGMVAIPTQGTYNASKFAVRGFTEALRLESSDTALHVMCVQPGGIRTNIARSARFHVGPRGEDHATGIRNFDQVARSSPEQAAQAIIRGIRRRRPRCLIGADARLVDLIQRLFPVNYWNLIQRLLPKTVAD